MGRSKCGIDAEEALSLATDKFIGRFTQVEQKIEADGKKMSDMPLTELDKYWDAVKAEDFPPDLWCTDMGLLIKWMAVEGLTWEDLDAKGDWCVLETGVPSGSDPGTYRAFVFSFFPWGSLHISQR